MSTIMMRWLLGGTDGQYAAGVDSWKVEWRAVKGVTFNPSTQFQTQLDASLGPASGNGSMVIWTKKSDMAKVPRCLYQGPNTIFQGCTPSSPPGNAWDVTGVILHEFSGVIYIMWPFLD